MDQLGFRLKLGVVTPSVNTVVQPEYDGMRPRGVTNHIARMHIRDDIEIHDTASWAQVVRNIDESLDAAVERVLTCEPDAVVMGVSIEAVYGDPRAGAAIEARLRAKFGANLKLVHAGSAIPAALRAYGITGGRVSVVTPYQPAAEEHISDFLGAAGYELADSRHLACRTTVGIAHVTGETLREKLRELAAGQPSAIIQFGANMCMARIADEAERWLNLPVIAVNAATYWHALRTNGIPDQIDGYGRLMAEH